jgi:hypothetical protein
LVKDIAARLTCRSVRKRRRKKGWRKRRVHILEGICPLLLAIALLQPWGGRSRNWRKEGVRTETGGIRECARFF